MVTTRVPVWPCGTALPPPRPVGCVHMNTGSSVSPCTAWLPSSWVLVWCWFPADACLESGGAAPAAAFLPLTGPGPCPSAGGTELLALSAKGRLMTCRLDLSPEPLWPSRVTAADTGRKIKDLLCGIGTVSER